MKRILGILLLTLLVVPAWSATPLGTVTISRSGESVTTIAWTSDADGKVLATIDPGEGYIARITTNPGDDSTSPSANYDVTLPDQDGADVMTGLGANRSQSATETVVPYIALSTLSASKVFTAGPLTLTILNAGNAKQGILRIYLSKED